MTTIPEFTASNLAGDHMTISEDDQGTTTITFDDKGTGRVCGTCQLCCKLLPVPTIGKAGGQRCLAQRHGKGCRIYNNRPLACRTWSCRWLADRETAGMPRPDRCHYVIDQEADTVRLAPHDGSPPTHARVFQVWVDPDHRQAYRAPELRDWMQRMAVRFAVPTIVRFSPTDAITVFPPAITADGQWHELDGQILARDELERKVLDDHAASRRTPAR